MGRERIKEEDRKERQKKREQARDGDEKKQRGKKMDRDDYYLQFSHSPISHSPVPTHLVPAQYVHIVGILTDSKGPLEHSEQRSLFHTQS